MVLMRLVTVGSRGEGKMRRTWLVGLLSALVGWMARMWAAISCGHSMVPEVGLVLWEEELSNKERKSL